MENKINLSYEQFLKDKDLQSFMESVSDFILRFTRKRLNRDPDIISEFYVHFYEKVGTCLSTFDNYQDLSFLGYFVTSIRHEFYNFIRMQRRQVEPTPTDNIIGMQSKLNLEEESINNSGDDKRHKLSREVGRLPMQQRLPVKLYYGLELGLDELQELIGIHAEPVTAAFFLKEYRKRRSRRLTKVSRLQDRVRKLNHRIHSYDMEEDSKQTWFMYKRWKARIIEVLQNEKGIYTMQELGDLLQVNKTTIARRIKKGKDALRGLLICQTQQITA